MPLSRFEYSIFEYHKALLPVRASEQVNVIGLISVYIYVCVQFFFVIELMNPLPDHSN